MSYRTAGIAILVLGVIWSIGLGIVYFSLEMPIREYESIRNDFEQWKIDLLAQHNENPENEEELHEALMHIFRDNPEVIDKAEELFMSRSRRETSLKYSIDDQTCGYPLALYYVYTFRSPIDAVFASDNGKLATFWPGILQVAILFLGGVVALIIGWAMSPWSGGSDSEEGPAVPADSLVMR